MRDHHSSFATRSMVDDLGRHVDGVARSAAMLAALTRKQKRARPSYHARRVARQP